MSPNIITFQDIMGTDPVTGKDAEQDENEPVSSCCPSAGGTDWTPLCGQNMGVVHFDDLMGEAPTMAGKVGLCRASSGSPRGRGIGSGFKPAPPAWTGTPVPPQFLPVGEDEVHSYARRRDQVDDEPWLESGDTNPDIFGGLYKTYVYELQFMAPTENALPQPVVFSGASFEEPEEHAYSTFMRIHIPEFTYAADYERLGVVLLMVGGTGLSQAQDAVVRDEAEAPVDQKWLMSVLASGLSHPTVYSIDQEWPKDAQGTPFFRDGDPMIVVTFSYPGRGTNYPGSGAPDFIGDTLANAAGQDHAGVLTNAATEAVVDATLEIVEYIKDNWTGSGDLGVFGNRLVVCSWSWGSYPAARWVATTAHDVHALVDYEGPCDSEEAASFAYNPFGVSATSLDLPEGDLPDGLPQELLDFDVWAAWYQENPDHFVCRPPVSTLGDLPSSWASFAAGIVDRPSLSAWWIARYDAPRHIPALVDQLATFWVEREPVWRLPNLLAKQVAYVRIQCEEDHFQPPWMFQRHAVKSLNAAYSAVLTNNVFYTDEIGYAAYLRSEGPISPANWSIGYDPDDSSQDWATSRFWAVLDTENRWGIAVDLVRWSVEETFEWVEVADSVSDESGAW
jgi:hypothetical protein